MQELIDLRQRGAEAEHLWRNGEGSHVPLPLAAALALHAVRTEEDRGAKNAQLPAGDYEVALNFAAAALSRLVALYAVDKDSSHLAPVHIVLGEGRFRHGATQYDRWSGSPVTSLVVARTELAPALKLIRATCLPIAPL